MLIHLLLTLAQDPQGIVMTKGDTQITIGAALRFRAETRDPDPATDTANSDTSSLGRFRAHFDFLLNKDAQAFIQFQETVSPDGAPSSDTLHQAFGRLNGLADLVDLQIGRFEMLYGGELMISKGDWSKTGTAFDGLRVSHAGESFLVDFFATQPVEGQGVPLGMDQSFMGVYGTMNHEAMQFEGYVLVRDDRHDASAGTDDATVGGRFLWSQKGGIAIMTEAAMQTGDHGAASAGGTLFTADAAMPVMTNLQVGLNVLYASGDGDAADGDDDAFAPLYNTAHKFVGASDLFVVTNVIDVQPYVTYAVAKGWKVTGAVHLLTLADEDGALPDLRGGLVKAAGESDLGIELEVLAWKTIFEEIDLHLGLSQFLAGDAIANGEDQLWGVVQVQFFI
jgi:hypothetical protein